MKSTRSTFSGIFLIVGVALILCGCFGYTRHSREAEFEEINITPGNFNEFWELLYGRPELKTPDDVLALFGPPLLKSQEGENEVWSYKLAGPPTETTSDTWIAWGVMVPFSSTTKYDANTKFYFRNSVLEKVMVLRSHSKGGGCLLVFPFSVGCPD
jgi:hypothetical protein